jgi:hypothetical protein
LAAKEGLFARAARLLAAATATELSRLWSRRMPAEDAERDACLAEARAALGEEAFASAWAAGVAMHPDEAVEEALAMDEVPGG